MKGLSFGLLLAIAGSAGAQLPRWSLDVAGGNGRHTEVTPSAWFFDNQRAAGRFTLAARVFHAHALGVYLEGEMLPDLGTEVELVSCTPAPTGGCMHQFMPGGEMSIGVAGRYAPVSRLSLGAGAGVGRSVNGTRPDGVRTNVHGDAALALLPHLAATMQYRYARWTSKGDTYWFAPLTFGVRVY